MSTHDSQPDDDPGSEPTVVEYCVNNVSPTTRDRLGNTSGCLETRGLPCLERCGTCRRTDFLAVDGEILTAASHGTLLGDLPGVTQ